MSDNHFKTLESHLRSFFGRVCKCLTNDDFSCVRENFPGKSSFEEFEYKDFIFAITKGAKIERDGSAKLFGKHPTTKVTINDLHFVLNLRNKYSHEKGTIATLDSKNQLADMIVVQRTVFSLARFCESDGQTDELSHRVAKCVDDLVVQVAQVTKPEQFDTEGEEKILSSTDREFIVNAFREAVREKQPADSDEGLPIPKSADHNPHLTNEIFDIQDQLKKIEKKLAPVGSFKGQINSLESAILSNVSDLQSTVESMYTDLKEGDFVLANEQDEIDEETENDEEFDRYTQDNEEEDDDDEYDEDEDEDDDEDLDDYDDNRNIDGGELSPNLLKRVKLKRPNPPSTISRWQARDEMISLRRRIWRETGEGPGADGLLRRSMIDEFLTRSPSNASEANRRMGWLLKSVSIAQMPYLDDVCEIVSRIENKIKDS